MFWVSQEYLYTMFVRKKRNKSGVISIQIIDKSTGKYKLLKTIGSSDNTIEVDRLYQEGLDYVKHFQGQQTINFSDQDFKEAVKQSIRKITIEGINLLLGRIYTDVGFDKVENELLRPLVLIRLSHPASKLKTSKHLKRYFSIDIKEDRIYKT